VPKPKHLAWTLHLPADCRMDEVTEDVATPNAEALAAQAIAEDNGSIFHDMD
jgi:hypothetical protein